MRTMAPCVRGLQGVSLLVATLFSFTAATPTEYFPFNSQLPPVARYGEAYSYTFSSDTYQSSETIVFSAPDLPYWLKFDASTRTLSGTPPSSDSSNGDQELNFTLQAADSTGTLSSVCKLQLTTSTAPQPQPADALMEVLEDAGRLSDSSSLVLQPGKDFEITFPSDYFTSNGRDVIGHYSVTEDHSPLPIWLHFDGGSGKYWGTAPPATSEIAQAQGFGVLHIVSTYAGFADASSQFNLMVGAHALSTNLSTDDVNVTVGEFFQYQIPLSNIMLDGDVLTASNVSSIDVSLPSNASWMSYIESNMTIMGTPPSSAANGSYGADIKISDAYNDTVTFTAEFSVQDKENSTVFSSSSLKPANVTRGEFFTYSIREYLLSTNADISVDTSGNDWISYHSSNYSLIGQVPQSFNRTTITFSADTESSVQKARKDTSDGSDDDSDDSSDGVAGASAKLNLVGVNRVTTTSASSSSSSSSSATATSSHTSATSAATSTATAAAATTKKKSNNRSVAIGCGVGIPLGCLLILGILFFCCWRRRKQQREAAVATPKGGDVEKAADTPGDRSISAPRPLSNGLVMAPVFKSSASTSSGLSDGTAIGNDTEYKDAKETQEWNSPQRMSTYNFLRMDGDSSGDHGNTSQDSNNTDQHTLLNMEPQHAVGVPAPNSVPTGSAGAGTAGTAGAGVAGAGVAGAAAAGAAGAAVVGVAAAGTGNGEAGAGAGARDSMASSQYSEEDNHRNVPRESWRHTNIGERRWQDARISYSSLASIPGSEPPTVQMASDEFAPPQSNMVRDESSGIVHRFGSHSSSLRATPESATPRAGDVSVGRFGAFDRTPQMSTTDAENAHENMYNTSSGNDDDEHFDAHSDDSLQIRPYRDAAGALRWDETTGDGKLVTSTVTRKPSKVGNRAPDGHTGELAFV